MTKLVDIARVALVPQPKSDELVVLEVDLNTIDLDTAVEIHHKFAREIFLNNNVVTIPTGVQINMLNKEDISDLIEHLEKFAETGQW